MKTLFTCILSVAMLLAKAQNRLPLDSIKTVLEDVFTIDQSPRFNLDSLQQKYGVNSKEVMEYWKLINTTDSLNKIAVTAIIDRYGWLGATETSVKANTALFLVIQHADVQTQLRYLPVLKKAIGQGKAEPANYAYLYDRVRMNTGFYQLYGTQVGGDYKGNLIFWPIADEPHVNQRRKALGLNPMQDYAKNFNIIYKAPRIDLLNGKVIINGYVADEHQNALAGVKVYISSKKLVTQTNHDGAYRLILPRPALRSAFIFRKKGFRSTTYNANEKGDVFYISTLLQAIKWSTG